MEFSAKLGLGLIPTARQCEQIYALNEALASEFDFTFWARPGVSIPHLTLFQGVFRSESEVSDAVERSDLSVVRRREPVQGLSIWAEKILFLDAIKTSNLAQAHQRAFAALFPICQGRSADTQNFQNITAGQQRSFETTGYPFSQGEYLPHATLAHLKVGSFELVPAAHRVNEIFSRKGFPSEFDFSSLVIYRVEPLGACNSFVWERKL